MIPTREKKREFLLESEKRLAIKKGNTINSMLFI
jgi:hypothetical protein